MKKKIVIFGGSFNPPLNSHFSVAQEVLNELTDVQSIVFVPVNQLYSKKGLVGNEDRMAMLNLVIQKNEAFQLSDIDMHADHSLYMIEIMEQMEKQYPDKDLCFLLGSDNLKDLINWRNAEMLLTKYPVIVMARDSDEVDNIISKESFLQRHQDHIIQLPQSIKSNFSSTYVREQIKQGKSVRYLMPDEVYDYIKERGLYS